MGEQAKEQLNFGFEEEETAPPGTETPGSPAGCLADSIRDKFTEPLGATAHAAADEASRSLQTRAERTLVTPHGKEVIPQPHTGDICVMTGVTYVIETVGIRDIDGILEKVILIRQRSGQELRLIPVKLLEKVGEQRWALKHPKPLDSFKLG